MTGTRRAGWPRGALLTLGLACAAPAEPRDEAAVHPPDDATASASPSVRVPSLDADASAVAGRDANWSGHADVGGRDVPRSGTDRGGDDQRDGQARASAPDAASGALRDSPGADQSLA